MSADIPVTKRHIVIESGSTSNAAGTCNVPTEIHAKRLTVTPRDEWCVSSTNVEATTPVPIAPTCFSLKSRPSRSNERNPHSGKRRTSVAAVDISALHLRELVDRRRRATTKYRDHDAESDGDFSRGDDHHKKDNGLTTDVAERAREGDEGEVDGVQHQFNAHEHDERRAPSQESESADPEEHGGQDEVPRGGDVHALSSPSVEPSRRASN